MANGNAYEMEMNGARKRLTRWRQWRRRWRRQPATMAAGAGIAYTPCGARVLFSFVVSPLFSTSAVLLPLLAVLALVVVFPERLARLVTRAKVTAAACAAKGNVSKKNCCAIASTVAWIFVTPPGAAGGAERSSRQFTCTCTISTVGNTRFFSWVGGWRGTSVNLA